ncbi:MAG: type 4a pilus biogenesis protein PilO, partial [Planctomycetes bacterium]|nr:type 4a pilus biogenesis protein PilO [Planctomycetota bacterium]
MLNVIRNAKKKAWIIIGVSTALVFSCAGVVWMDHGTIKEEDEKIAGLEASITKAEGRISKIRGHEDRVLRGRLVVKEYAKILPSDKDIHEFVKRITEFSVASGVEISELNDSDARNRGRRQSKDPFQKINYKLKLRGDLGATLDFINRFESYERFVKVGQLKIASETANSRDAGEGIRHNVDLELETYVYEPGRALTAVEIANSEKRTFEILEKEPLNVDLAMDSYVYQPRSDRRDPFADPRRSIGTGAGEGPIVDAEVEAQIAKLEELVVRFETLKRDLAAEDEVEGFVARMEYAKRLSQSFIDFKNEVEELRKVKFFSKADLLDRFDEEIAEPFLVLLAEREATDGEGLKRQELMAQLEHYEHAFSEGRFSDVVDGADAILSAKTDLDDPEIHEILEGIQRVAGRARARIEFAQMSLAITGYVILENRPTGSVVIIN